MDFSRIANTMSGDNNPDMFKSMVNRDIVKEISFDESSTPNINSESTNMEILDYIMVQLCHCLDTKKMAFKGGYILNKIIPAPEIPRATTDVDFSISVSEYYNDVKNVLRAIGEYLLKSNVIQSYEIKDTIGPTSSGGIKLHRDSSIMKDLGVDVGLHDISYGVVPMKVFGSDTQRFSIERMLSDKISAIYSRKRFRRPKDLYDFYILTNCFDVSMSELLKQVDIRSTINWDASPMSIEVSREYRKAYDKLYVLDPIDNSKVITKPEFDVALRRVSDFVDNWNSSLLWKCEERRFVRC